MSSIEITEVQPLPSASQSVHAFAFDSPATGESADTDGFVLSGWVLGKTEPIRTLTVTEAGKTLIELSVGSSPRIDVAAAYPDAIQPEASGFHGWVPAFGLDASFRLEIQGIGESGRSVPLAIIAGRRGRPQPSDSTGTSRRQRRALPQFFIIGAQRAGTRALYDHLITHPAVQPASTAEVHFFSLFFDHGLNWYLRQFPAEEPGTIVGEASPYYVFHPLAAERMHAVVPEAKLILLLRDPVDRAYSHYHHEVREGYEPLSFEEAIAAEPERLAGEQDRLQADDTYISFPHQHYSYLARGRYSEQVRRWLSLFPRDQLLIVKSEDVYRDPEPVLERVTSFLHLPAMSPAPVANDAETGYEPMSPETRQRLRSYFTAENADLVDLAGPEFVWDDEKPER